jgi:8-oxo-dGTP pyrophosphatase MutT (NUDIX family)
MENCSVASCGALIYCTVTQRYLFLLRNATKHADSWGLVGGKVEAGETVIEGLHREITEEVGNNFSYSKIIPIEQFTSDNGKFVFHTFLIPIKEEFVPKLNHEHRGYCWVPLKDHPRPLHPGVWRSFKFAAIVDKLTTMESVFKDQPLE